MKHVTVGVNEIYGVDLNNDIYRCHKPCIGELGKMSLNDGNMTQIDATINGVFGVSTRRTIYNCKLPQ